MVGWRGFSLALTRGFWLLVGVCGGLLLLTGWLAAPVLAAPAENVAARDRDEDGRVARVPPRGGGRGGGFLPRAAALAGVVGVVIAGRLRERRLGQVARVAAPLLALAFSLG